MLRYIDLGFSKISVAFYWSLPASEESEGVAFYWKYNTTIKSGRLHKSSPCCLVAVSPFMQARPYLLLNKTEKISSQKARSYEVTIDNYQIINVELPLRSIKYDIKPNWRYFFKKWQILGIGGET